MGIFLNQILLKTVLQQYDLLFSFLSDILQLWFDHLTVLVSDRFLGGINIIGIREAFFLKMHSSESPISCKGWLFLY